MNLIEREMKMDYAYETLMRIFSKDVIESKSNHVSINQFYIPSILAHTYHFTNRQYA